VYLKKFKDLSKAVQLLAIAQLRKLRTRIAAREHALELAYELNGCSTHAIDAECVVVVLSSERSCCGKLNNAVLLASRETIDAYLTDRKMVHIVSVGWKGSDNLAFKYRSYMRKRISDTCASSFALAYVLVLCVMDTSFDKCYVFFSKYNSMFEQVAAVYEFTSFSQVIGYLHSARKDNLFYDLLLAISVRTLSHLYLYNVILIVLDALDEHTYSELGCRAFSMETAHRNAITLINEYMLQYNKARQADITTALLEVVSGATYVE